MRLFNTPRALGLCLAGALATAPTVATAAHRIIEFENKTGRDDPVDDLHIETTLGSTITGRGPFEEERGANGGKKHNLYAGQVAKNGKAKITIDSDFAEIKIKRWWWTLGGNALADGDRVGREHVDDDDGGRVLAMVGPGTSLGTGEVLVAIAGVRDVFQVAPGRTPTEVVSDFERFLDERFWDDEFDLVYSHRRGGGSIYVAGNVVGDPETSLELAIVEPDPGVGLRLLTSSLSDPTECVPGDFNGDGRSTVADALQTFAAARGLRPTLTGVGQPVARPGAPITLHGAGLVSGEAGGMEIVVREGDDVPRRERQRWVIEQFEVHDGAVSFELPAVDIAGKRTFAVELTRTAIDPESGNELAFRSNTLALAVDLVPAGLARLEALDDLLDLAVLGEWGEDWDGDGVNDHFFHDYDGDGNPDYYRVDADQDGHDEEAGIDTDDDGDWDTLHEFDEEGKKTSVKVDTDGDGRFDYGWTDADGDGEMDDDECEPIKPTEAVPEGPRPRTNGGNAADCICEDPEPGLRMGPFGVTNLTGRPMHHVRLEFRGTGGELTGVEVGAGSPGAQVAEARLNYADVVFADPVAPGEQIEVFVRGERRGARLHWNDLEDLELGLGDPWEDLAGALVGQTLYTTEREAEIVLGRLQAFPMEDGTWGLEDRAGFVNFELALVEHVAMVVDGLPVNCVAGGVGACDAAATERRTLKNHECQDSDRAFTTACENADDGTSSRTEYFDMRTCRSGRGYCVEVRGEMGVTRTYDLHGCEGPVTSSDPQHSYICF